MQKFLFESALAGGGCMDRAVRPRELRSTEVVQ